MAFKILAMQRMKAMGIKRGDNFSHGEHAMKDFLRFRKVGECKLESLNHDNSQALLSIVNRTSVRFLLVGIGPDFHEKFSKAPKSMRIWDLGVQPLASISSFKTKGVFNVGAIWVSPTMRKKGIGKTLYTLVYHKVAGELTSSTDLGTMSLATWISLYNTYKTIYMKDVITQRIKVPILRKDITIDGLTIYAKIDGKKVELTSEDTRDFIFVWPK